MNPSAPPAPNPPAPGSSPSLSAVRHSAFRGRGRALAWALFLGVGVAVAVVDLWTKQWAFEKLRVSISENPLGDGRPRMLYQTPSGQPENIEVIPGYFEFEASLNYGAFSGWFSDFTGGLAILSAVALAVIVWFIYGHLKQVKGPSWVFVVALGLLWGGTLGNFYDRYFIGAVRDFIKWFVVIDGDEKVWPNFNIADSAICVGVTILALFLVFGSAPASRPGPDDRALA